MVENSTVVQLRREVEALRTLAAEALNRLEPAPRRLSRQDLVREIARRSNAELRLILVEARGERSVATLTTKLRRQFIRRDLDRADAARHT